MDVSALPKLSADCHVDEPHDLWYERLPESMRDLAPRRIQRDDDGGWSLVVDGSPIGWLGARSTGQAQEMEQERIDAISVDRRLDMLRTDSLRGEVIFPTIGLYVWGIEPEHGDVGEACCRIQRLDRRALGGEPRIKLAGMIDLSVDGAVAAERLASDPSIACIMLPIVGPPTGTCRNGNRCGRPSARPASPW
jgi:hypothetical protein